MGSYKFAKFKGSPNFVKELESFHFGEKIFHRSDSQGKVAAHRPLLKVNFKYTDHVVKDEEIYRNIYNMTDLNKRLKKKTTIARFKGSNSCHLEPKGQEEEIVKKGKEDTARRLAEGAKKI